MAQDCTGAEPRPGSSPYTLKALGATVNQLIHQITNLGKDLTATRQWVADLEEMHGRLEHRVDVQQAGLKAAALDPPNLD